MATIHPKTFLALLGDTPKIETRNGVKATGKVHDGDGLYLIVGTGAQRSWLFRYRLHGVNRELNLGSAHKLDLGAARKARGECETLLSRNVDPKEQRGLEKTAAMAKVSASANRKTVHEIATLAVVDIGPSDLKLRKYWINKLAPEKTAGLGGKAPADVTPQDVANALKAIRGRCGTLAQSDAVQTQLWRLFEWCAAPGRGFLAEDAPNPANFKGRAASLLPKVKRRQMHHASVPFEDIRPVLASLRTMPGHAPLAVEWTLLSASRSGPVILADWAEIDAKAKTWTIPGHKMKVKDVGDFVVPLTTRHLQILAILAPNGFPASGPLFTPQFKRDQINKVVMNARLRKAYPKLVKRLDGSLRLACIHGLRTTFRTWGEQQLTAAGLKLYAEATLEECLSHSVGNDVRNSYVAETNVEARRTVLAAWAVFLDKPATPALALAA